MLMQNGNVIAYASHQLKPYEQNYPMRGVMRFGKKGKLSLRFVGSFEITQRVGS
jgi:hypothetical protein